MKESRLHESNLHALLRPYQVANSEWFAYERSKICTIIDNYFAKMNNVDTILQNHVDVVPNQTLDVNSSH